MMIQKQAPPNIHHRRHPRQALVWTGWIQAPKPLIAADLFQRWIVWGAFPLLMKSVLMIPLLPLELPIS
jgi:hypothetical protein